MLVTLSLKGDPVIAASFPFDAALKPFIWKTPVLGLLDTYTYASSVELFCESWPSATCAGSVATKHAAMLKTNWV
jgi:hypothetical protein